MQELAFFHVRGGPDELRPARRQAPATGSARTTIAVQGARVHNLKNISVEIPRDRLIVVTGLSGSGKSSLAFDTIYAEGQRRYMESLSTYAKRFVAQVAKPDVDFVFGLSPVISIEQKTIANNPRSTVGTMTDIASYLNLLFATIGQAALPATGEPTPSRTSSQILEAILSLPEGAEIELRAPVFKVYGEDFDFVFTEVRKKGCRRLIIDGKPWTSPRRSSSTRSSHSTWTPSWTASSSGAQAREGDPGGDRRHAAGGRRAAAGARRQGREQGGGGGVLPRALQHRRTTSSTATSLPSSSCSTTRRAPAAPAAAWAWTSSRIRTCWSPIRKRSIAGGCFVKEAFKYNPDTWDGRMMFSLAKTLGSRSTRRGRSCPRRRAQRDPDGIEPKK